MKMSETQNRNPLNVAFGSAVRSLRKGLAITQEELAGRAGLHRTYVTNVERGVCNLSLGSISKLASALGTSISSLLVDVEVSQTRLRKTGDIAFGAPKTPVEILLAEDDENDALLLQRAFKKARLRDCLHVVVDGEQAINYLSGRGAYSDREKHPLPFLMLLDLRLANAGGLAVLRRLKEDARTRAIPVVILTVEDRGREIAECSRLGAETWIAKPVNFERLSQVIPKLNFRWLLLRQQERFAA